MVRLKAPAGAGSPLAVLAAATAAVALGMSAAGADARARTVTYEFRIERISLQATATLDISTTERLDGGATRTIKESVVRRLRVSHRGTAADAGVFNYRPGLPRGVPVGGVQTRRPVAMTITEAGPWSDVTTDRFGNRTERSGSCGGPAVRLRRWAVGADFLTAGPRVKVTIPLVGLTADFPRDCFQEPSLSSETDKAAGTLGVAYLRSSRTIVIPVRFSRVFRQRGRVERVTWSGEIVARRS